MADTSSSGGIQFEFLYSIINSATEKVKTQLQKIQQSDGQGGNSLQIGDMFQTQMLMNNLAQMSEMSTSVISSMNQSLASMARNVKG